VSADYVYTVDDCLGQIVDHIETVGLEDASNLFIRDCLVRLWKSAAKDGLAMQTGDPP